MRHPGRRKQMQIKQSFYKIWNWRRCYIMLENLRQFAGSKIAKQRHKIIDFYEKYGENPDYKPGAVKTEVCPQGSSK
jgi:hypothetical protein